jgi:hypothetical protein
MDNNLGFALAFKWIFYYDTWWEKKYELKKNTTKTFTNK